MLELFSQNDLPAVRNALRVTPPHFSPLILLATLTLTESLEVKLVFWAVYSVSLTRSHPSISHCLLGIHP